MRKDSSERTLKLFLFFVAIIGTFVSASLANANGDYQTDFSTSGTPPETEWNKTLIDSASNTFIHSVRQTSDGGYIAAGEISGPGWLDILLIKTDSSGNKEWEKRIDSGGYDTALSVRQISDGGYIMAGTHYGGFSLVKTDSSGNVVWIKSFVSAAMAYSVQQTSDGGYILTGHNGAGDILLVKTDCSGNEEWRKTFGGSDNDFAYSLQQTSDGGYIIGARTKSYGAGDWDFWLIKTDSLGNKLWDKTFGDGGSAMAYSVQQTSDGGYIMAGSTNSIGAGSYDAWLIKTDSSGNKEWDNTFGGSLNDEIDSVQQTSDGGYIMAGYTCSFGEGGKDAWLLKTDSSGNEKWQKTFGGSDDDASESAQQTSDGSYIISGYTYQGGVPYKCWLIKWKSDERFLTVEMFDGSEFSDGTEVFSDPQKLIVDATEMNGVVTDGVTRLLVRMEVNDLSDVTFSLEGESNNPEDDNGFLQSIDDQDNQQKNQLLTVKPSEVGYVFIIYCAPGNFVRQGIDKNQDGTDDDAIISERVITLTAKVDGKTIATKEIELVRPPLLLIHGLWSGPEMWNSFETMLNGTVNKQDFYGFVNLADLTTAVYTADNIWEDLIENGYIDEKGVIQDKFSQISDYSEMTVTLGTIMYSDPYSVKQRIYDILHQQLLNKIKGLQVYRVDYSNKNSNWFDDNSDVPYSNPEGDNIQKIKEKYKKTNKIAITQIDILGHSMGGLLARIWVGAGNKVYKRNDNFWQGDIHKFITLDSPHSGSFLADLVTQSLEESSDGLKLSIISTCKALKRDIINGAVYDMITESGEIIDMNAKSVNVLTHVIAGGYLVSEDNLDNIPGDIGSVLRLLRMLHHDPTSYVKEGNSDLVVSLSSQLGEINPNATSKFGHQHTDSTTQEVASEVIDLLNSDGESNLFDNISWSK